MSSALVVCSRGHYCELVGGDAIYPHRPDLHQKKFWKCRLCPDSYVGCHPGTEEPLGTAADAETRKARSNAHRYFDQIWKSGRAKRTEAYAWLRVELGMPKVECHISMFDVATCERAIGTCRRLLGLS